jgi:hypothetical protein
VLALPRARLIGSLFALEVAFDLPEHGNVLTVVEGRAPLLQLQLRLVIAIEKLEPEIELGQDGVAEDLEASIIDLLIGTDSRWRGEL